MLQQLKVRFVRLVREAWTRAVPGLRAAAIVVAGIVRGPLKAILQVAAALILLFAEWGWEPLVVLLSRLSKYFVFARLEAWIATLPPYGALALFAAPAVCLIPLKLAALYLFATGHRTLGIGLIIFAKIAGTAVVARLYLLVRPQLMQIGWFKSAHDQFVPWKEQKFVEIRASGAWRTGRIVRVEAKRGLNRVWIGLKPQRQRVAAALAGVRDEILSFFDDLRRGLR